MRYEGVIIRPPSEAQSLILQVTRGCSHNRCTFCPTYKGTRFRIRQHEEIVSDVQEASTWAGQARRIFLCDGDALVVPQRRLVPLLDLLNERFPYLERIGIYANARSILNKSVEELRELRRRRLGIVYLGVESGDQEVLKRIRKGADREKILKAGLRVKEAGIILSVTVLLGIGGVQASHRHALETASLLNEMDPEYVGALTLMVVPGTPLYQEAARGDFRMPDVFQLIEELGLMIAHSEFTHCYFTSNHASNYLPVRVHLPQQKEDALKLIRGVLSSRDPSILRPEFMRGL
ncbi:MAG: radical SAM protein [Thermodesulfobacteriota bacterium]